MEKGSRQETTFAPLGEETFHFRCHKGISCFTECCADLSLILTPYDIVRLRSRLGISSGEFIDRYTEPKMDEPYRFPVIRLVMNEDERRTCPFLTPDGCAVYEDRPAACRIYPLGRAAMSLEQPGQKAKEKFFLVRESHCLGFEEDPEWTAKEWMASEGVDEYNTVNDPWMRILTSRRSLGAKAVSERKLKMFAMASYNPDRFRDFLFESPFFQRFDVDAETRDRIASDDKALLDFAFQWLNFSLFGEKTMKIREEA
ncbi:MAG: YkgJ family cysteine cluster protein [Desulfobacteraceae bacterium]|jgi:hypothetical protein